MALLVILITVDDPSKRRFVETFVLDLMILFFLLATIFRTSKKYRKPNILAACSIILLIVGNFLFILPEWGIFDGVDNYYIFLNLASFEVVAFAISLAYRNYFLKKEYDSAMNQVLENLKASDLLKEQLNKELEIKVKERTKQIKQMNDLLSLHNIQLKSEVKSVNEARVFHKLMNFEDFKKTFADDESCIQYLAKIKWKPKQIIKCKKCGYSCTNLANLSKRCA